MKAFKDNDIIYNITEMNEREEKLNNIIQNTIKVGEELGIDMLVEHHNKKLENIPNYPNLEDYIIVAQDCWLKSENTKQYFYSKDPTLMEEFVSKLPNHNLYECITKTHIKPYLDIDDLVDFNKEKSIVLITHIIDKFNDCWNTDITINDVIVLTRNENADEVKSLHIIIPQYNISKSQLKFFSKKYNCEYGDIIKLDESIYNNNKFFSMKYQSKLKHNYTRNFIDLINEDIWESDDYYINVCEGDDIDETDEYLTYTSVELQLEKQNNSKKDPSNWRDRIPNHNDKDVIKLNKYNTIQQLLKYLPKEFFLLNQTKYISWRKLTLNLSYHKINHLLDWCSQSAEIIEDMKYENPPTTQSNMDYVKKYNDAKYMKKDFREIIVGVNDYCKNYTNEDTDQQQTINNLVFSYKSPSREESEKIKKWIVKRTRMGIETIDMKFDKAYNNTENIKPKFIQIAKDIVLDLKTLNLQVNNTYYNYWVDEVYKRNEKDLINFKEHSKEEIRQKVNKFYKNNRKLFGVNMKWGEGKSYYIMTEIIKMAMDTKTQEKRQSVLIITENNALNGEVYDKCVKDYGDEIVASHLKNKKNGFTKEHFITICSMESLPLRTAGITYDIVIMDEAESIIAHLESSTIRDTNKVIKSINSKITNCSKILCMDADLNMTRLTPIINLLKLNDEDITLLYSNENKWEQYKFNVFNDNEFEFVEKIVNDLKSGKKLAIACMSRRTAVKLNEYITILQEQKKLPKFNILIHTSEERNVNGEYVDKDDKLNINEIINNYDIGLWIYSPTIKCGISYNTDILDDGKTKNPRFNKTYLFTNIMSCCMREAIQMLFRVRDLIDTEINILIDRLDYVIDEPSEEELEKFLLNNINLSYHNDRFNEITKKIDKSELESSPFYLELKKTNLREIFMSLWNLGHELLKRLIINHNLNVIHKIKTISEEEASLIKDNLQKAELSYKRKQSIKLASSQYISDSKETIVLRKKIVNPHDYDNIYEIRKKDYLKKLSLSNNDYRLLKPTPINLDNEEDEPKALGNITQELLRYKTRELKPNIVSNDTQFQLINIEHIDKTGIEYESVGNCNEETLIEKMNNFKMDNGIINEELSNKIQQTHIELFNKYKNLPTTDKHQLKKDYRNLKIEWNNNIQQREINYNNFIHTKVELYDFIQEQFNSTIDYINEFNKFLFNNKKEEYLQLDPSELVINHDTLDKNGFIKTLIILKDFFPQIIIKYNERNYLIYFDITFTRKEFINNIEKNIDTIKNNYDFWNKLLSIDTEHKKLFDEFNINNEKHISNIYKLLKSVLMKIGYILKAPKNLKQLNSIYTLKPDRKIHYERDNTCELNNNTDLYIKNQQYYGRNTKHEKPPTITLKSNVKTGKAYLDKPSMECIGCDKKIIFHKRDGFKFTKIDNETETLTIKDPRNGKKIKLEVQKYNREVNDMYRPYTLKDIYKKNKRQAPIKYKVLKHAKNIMEVITYRPKKPIIKEEKWEKYDKNNMYNMKINFYQKYRVRKYNNKINRSLYWKKHRFYQTFDFDNEGLDYGLVISDDEMSDEEDGDDMSEEENEEEEENDEASSIEVEVERPKIGMEKYIK